MSMLWKNPLGQMYGPDFLVLFTVVAVLVILTCRWWISRIEAGVELKSPCVCPDLGPYEVAYLRGGAEEASRLAILGLFQKGYLAVTRRVSASGRNPELVETSTHPPVASLVGIERLAFDALAESGSGLPTGASCLAEAAEEHLTPMKARLSADGLLAAPRVRGASVIGRWTGSVVLLALAGYKLAAALLNGRHNVALLLILLIIALIILCAVTTPPWLSARGKRYMKSLSDRLSPEVSRLELSQGTNAPSVLLLAGVFGFGLLENTGYSAVSEVFKHRETGVGTVGSDTGGGCGGSCGGGCGGCGGCGG